VVYFAVVLPLNALTARFKKPEPEVPPATKTCPECLSEIPLAARRCAHCAQPVAELPKPLN
jgi:large conductance mechanosensitive channel